jgi:hypothetical protein
MPICVSHSHETCQSIECGRHFGDSGVLNLTPIISPLDDLRIHSDSDQDSDESDGDEELAGDNVLEDPDESDGDEELAGDNVSVLGCLIEYRDYATELPESLKHMLRVYAPKDTDPVFVTKNKQHLFDYIRKKIQEYSEHEVLLNSHIELIEDGIEDCQVPWVKEFFLTYLNAGRELSYMKDEVYYSVSYMFEAPSEPPSDEDE